MKLLNLKSLIFVGLLLICGMAFANEPDVYTRYQSNISVDKQNPNFQIKLKSNPSTGYTWSNPSWEGDTTLFAYQHSFEPSKKHEALVGSPGHDVWNFQTNDSAFSSKKLVKIHFIRSAPSGEPAEEVDFLVTIHSINGH